MIAARSALFGGMESLRRQLRLVDALRRQGALVILDTDVRTELSEAVYEVQQHIGSPAELASYYYNATIVSLYGLLERYVEDLLSEVVRSAARAVPSSAHLPERIRSHHLPLTLDVLNALQANRYRGEADTGSLIGTLDKYLGGTAGVHVNDQVFMHHTANFRSDVIRQSCERVGFSPLADMTKDSLFVELVKDRFPDEENIFYVVDDLAERRNEVAHGAPPQQLLTGALMLAYVDVVEAHLGALRRSAMTFLTRLAVEHAGEALGRPDHVFRKVIAGFEALPIAVRRGSTLGVVSGERAFCVEILSIEVANEARDEARSGESTGLRLSAELSTRSRLFLLPEWTTALVARG